MSEGAASKWRAPEVARGYRDARFATARAAGRDPRLVRRLLRRHARGLARPVVLDVPCGAGRLRPVLLEQGAIYAGIDASAEMLRVARELAPPFQAVQPFRAVQGDALALPVRDGAADVVVCCRLLHHLRDERDLARALAELVRASRALVIASFWDAASLKAWRVRRGLARDEGPRGRVSVSRGTIVRLLDAAGADVLGFAASARFLSQQTLVAARVRR